MYVILSIVFTNICLRNQSNKPSYQQDIPIEILSKLQHLLVLDAKLYAAIPEFLTTPTIQRQPIVKVNESSLARTNCSIVDIDVQHCIYDETLLCCLEILQLQKISK